MASDHRCFTCVLFPVGSPQQQAPIPGVVKNLTPDCPALLEAGRTLEMPSLRMSGTHILWGFQPYRTGLRTRPISNISRCTGAPGKRQAEMNDSDLYVRPVLRGRRARHVPFTLQVALPRQGLTRLTGCLSENSMAGASLTEGVAV